jgi:Kef-type K+ transport system membrane component KefB
MHGAAFVTDLAVVLGVAAITGVLARLMHQPTILGYLLTGLIVGHTSLSRYSPIPSV